MFYSSAVLFLLAVVGAGGFASASTEVKEEWVAIYDGGNYEASLALALATDSVGNVCMVGKSGYGYVTVKHNAGGSRLWVAKFD